MMILVGALIPSAIIIPELSYPPKIISLPSTWQVPALLLSALICGPRAGVLSAVAYLTIGLFYFPVFHNGGSLEYLVRPEFGYLAGFIPAAWLTGRLANQLGMNNFLSLTLSALAGLLILQFCGILNLIIGSSLGRWSESLPELIASYSLAPLPAQLVLCPGVGVMSLAMRRLLLFE